MAYLKLPSQTPPGGWIYFQKETRKWFTTDQGVEALALEVAEHRRYRGLSRASEDLALEDIQTQICERLGPEHCRPFAGENWQPLKRDLSRNLDGESALAFSRAFLEFAKGGAELVDEVELHSRAQICLDCHLNVKSEGCFGCSVLVGLVAAAIPSSRTYQELDTCAACGCALRAKVNMPMSVIRAADEGRGITYPPWCWAKE